MDMGSRFTNTIPMTPIRLAITASFRWGSGLNRYNPATETFTRYLPDPEDPASLSNGSIISIKGDSIWSMGDQ